MKHLIVGVAILAAACTDVAGPATNPITPVSSSAALSPAGGATNVSRSDTVGMTFTLPVDSASCEGRFTLHMGDSTGTMVPGRMRFDSTYRHMIFIPDSILAAHTPYFAHMRDSVMVRGSMGGGMMGGSQGGQMMIFNQPPTGAMRMTDGMGWSFTTGG